MKALIVDIDEDYLDIMKEILAREGIICDIARSIEIAIDMIKNEDYDLIITELYFRRDLLEEFFRIARMKNCKIIATTVLNELNGFDVDFLIEKPFDLKVIREILGRIKYKHVIISTHH